MRRWDNPFLVKESLSDGPAPELFQFLPQGSYSLFASQGDPDLLIWERSFNKLAYAVASFKGLICKPIHLDVDVFLKGTIPPFLFLICMWCNILILDPEWLGRDKVFEDSKEVCLRLLVVKGRRELFPWITMPLLSQSTTTGGIVSWYEEAAAYNISCAITPPSISPQYEPADVNFLAHVHLHLTFAIVQYIIVAAEEMLGQIFFMYDPSWMIIRDCASMPSSIPEPSPL